MSIWCHKSLVKKPVVWSKFIISTNSPLINLCTMLGSTNKKRTKIWQSAICNAKDIILPFVVLDKDIMKYHHDTDVSGSKSQCLISKSNRHQWYRSSRIEINAKDIIAPEWSNVFKSTTAIPTTTRIYDDIIMVEHTKTWGYHRGACPCKMRHITTREL